MLDDYIEAHVHGVISLKGDIRYLVVDLFTARRLLKNTR
ncbi:DUF3626 domain-containing protein [Vibrio chagasii]|nr:DUF3626 domain-containing protein [Vibrio chagasii]